ncbi:MAG: VWA containing CoxE family protein [Deltaproteobacteria bacterium]|nr:VWA containing CoxE family protein [Deltaproteobacteria bacterium]
MFDLLLFNLRRRDVKVGLGEWLAFLDGLGQGLVTDLESLYRFGRAVLVHQESQFDDWDLAFTATFEGVEVDEKLSKALSEWLDDAVASPGDMAHIDLSEEELRQQFYERLKEQKERHDGGNRWVGTGGTSPFGHSGRADKGIRAGGGGGGRRAIQVAGERQWADYREDRRLDHRDFYVALRALRSLTREGALELDIDRTIRKTADNAGDIDLHFQRKRVNRVHLRLVMDTGGSMSPHTRLVTQLFTAASEVKGFKSFEAWYFHNAPYGTLYKSFETRERQSIEVLLREWPESTRIVFVGDASMAPYELFEPWGYNTWGGRPASQSGLDWLRRIRAHSRASIWLNPDPKRWWRHPTVEAIGGVFPMFPLTLTGLRDGIKVLRRGH